jgi:hypothetical protein
MAEIHHTLADRCDAAENGCILWIGCRDSHGYGQLRVGGRKKKLAHRLSYELSVGPIPEGLHVLHRCDTPLCINPDHLFVGTNSDNVRDKLSKGRGTHGPTTGNAKLTPEDVMKIRNDSRTQRVIAAEYGVSSSRICEIKTRKAWNYLP